MPNCRSRKKRRRPAICIRKVSPALPAFDKCAARCPPQGDMPPWGGPTEA